jgi:hypothetical protein
MKSKMKSKMKRLKDEKKKNPPSEVGVADDDGEERVTPKVKFTK